MHRFALLLKKTLRTLAAMVLVPLLLFEEWGWVPLAALAARLGRLPFWAVVERRIMRLPPWAALLTFLLPVLLLLPVKLLALYLFGLGHFSSGLAVLIGAKLFGTAVVARLFQLTQPALMQMPFFARWYWRWKVWKDRVLAVVRQSAVWHGVRSLRTGVRRWWRVVRGGG